MGLVESVQDLATRIAAEAKSLRTLINGNAGDLSALITTAKSSLVAAINEVASSGGGGSGGGSPWTLVVDESGASMANWTATGGSWASADGVITQSSGGGMYRARHSAPVQTSVLIFEAEILLVSTSGGDPRAGLVVGYDGSNGNGALARLQFATAGKTYAQIEQDSNSGRLSVETDGSSLGVWRRIRVVTGLTVSIYLDGVLIGSAGNNVDASNNASYIGLAAGDCVVSFRNIRAWNLTMPDA